MTEKILIAEDNDDIRKLVMITLKKTGRELLETDNGESAMELVRSHKPALVVLDIMMPKMTGYQVCEAIKNDPSLQEIKVLFLTSRSGVSAEMAMTKFGCDAIMNKPFQPNELKAKVEQMLNLRSSLSGGSRTSGSGP